MVGGCWQWWLTTTIIIGPTWLIPMSEAQWSTRLVSARVVIRSQGPALSEPVLLGYISTKELQILSCIGVFQAPSAEDTTARIDRWPKRTWGIGAVCSSTMFNHIKQQLMLDVCQLPKSPQSRVSQVKKTLRDCLGTPQRLAPVLPIMMIFWVPIVIMTILYDEFLFCNTTACPQLPNKNHDQFLRPCFPPPGWPKWQRQVGTLAPRSSRKIDGSLWRTIRKQPTIISPSRIKQHV